MTTIKKASQAGARRVTATLDTMASLFQYHAASLGIPPKIAMDFAHRCDLLSDNIDKRRTAGYFDPSSIGVEQPGPMQYDQNNSFMAGEFTSEEFRNLSEKQMAGELADNAAKGVADPKMASFVKKVAFSAALQALRVARKADEDAPKVDEDKKSEETDDDAKEEKTAKKGEVPQALKDNQFKPKDEKSEEDKKSEEVEEAKKTARLFGLY